MVLLVFGLSIGNNNNVFCPKQVEVGLTDSTVLVSEAIRQSKAPLQLLRQVAVLNCTESWHYDCFSCPLLWIWIYLRPFTTAVCWPWYTNLFTNIKGYFIQTKCPTPVRTSSCLCLSHVPLGAATALPYFWMAYCMIYRYAVWIVAENVLCCPWCQVLPPLLCHVRFS
jgi:hypothetical protein